MKSSKLISPRIEVKPSIWLLAVASLSIALASAASPAQLREWAERYHLDPTVVATKYRSLISGDFGDSVRARMYFEEHKAFDVIASAVDETKLNPMLLVRPLLDAPQYSPTVVGVVLKALEKVQADPEQQAFAGYMTTALARWLKLRDPKLPFSARPEVSRKIYAAFLSQAKEKASAMKANSEK
jgi:hypothetical protein